MNSDIADMMTRRENLKKNKSPKKKVTIKNGSIVESGSRYKKPKSRSISPVEKNKNHQRNILISDE